MEVAVEISSSIRCTCGFAVAALVLVLLGTGRAPAATTCALVASPSGSDSAPGTPAAPFRTAQKLADSLRAGQTGCLRAGTYRQARLVLRRGGTSGAVVKLTSYP